MLLQSLKLHNIRSYLDQTITFPEGSSLLSGDIGCGKSTILLAIEFALFGTSRTDLPGEALLRKGSSQAEVELTFSLNNQKITIKRGLKKGKLAISQTPGYIIINDVKKELTPVEMKAEMINLLGYPEEFISKTKNYLFRYTVYTPQEEMKEILQENEEVRLDTLRKIFQIDKYKVVRDNLQFYLKQMRTQIAITKTRLEPLEEVKGQLNNFEQEQKTLNDSLQQLNPQLDQLKTKVELSRKELERKEEEQQSFLQLKQELQMMTALLEEKKLQEKSLIQQKNKVEEELSQLTLPLDKNRPDIEEEKKNLEEEKTQILSEKTSLTEKVAYLQKLIVNEEKESQKFQQEFSLIPEKEQKLNQLIKELSQLTDLPEKKKQLEELFNYTAASITQNETLLVQSKEMKNKITDLDSCPTCLQDVSSDHKHKITAEEEKKIGQAEKLLVEFNRQKNTVLEQKQEIENKIQQKIEKDNLLTRFKLELEQLQNRSRERQQKEEQVKEWLKEKENSGQRLAKIEEENSLKLIEEKLVVCQELSNQFFKKEQFEKQLEGVVKQEKENQEQITKLNLQNQNLNQQLSLKKDLSEEIVRGKNQLNEIREKEKTLSVEQAQLMTKKEGLIKQIENTKEQLNKLIQEKDKLTQTKELYHWLDNHFLKLTYTIEKHVMTNIHNLFNQLFQEWFAILIDDENIYSTLDDSFYPVIEQNGYEVSFSNLSGGEKTSASLAYRLALNRVINDVVHQVKTKDLLILDEPTDGFSSEQLDKVRDVLEKLGLRQTIIVSHESKIESFVENVIRIGKEGHVSRVG